MTCQICLSNSLQSLEIKGYPVFKCQRCGHLFLQDVTNINTQNEIYGDSYFFGNEDGYINYLENKDNLIEQGHWYADLIKKYRLPGLILDIGAAAGYILKGFIDRGWSGIGIEPNQNMVEYGKRELGLNMQAAYIETFQTDILFDLISAIQVAHHFFDLRGAFEKFRQMTNPKGYLLIETWKTDSFVARLSGVKWHAYNPPSTRNWFTTHNLQNLALQFGFKEINRGRRFKKIKGSFLKRKVSSVFKSLIPNNANFIYLGDDLYWTLFQKV